MVCQPAFILLSRSESGHKTEPETEPEIRTGKRVNIEWNDSFFRDILVAVGPGWLRSVCRRQEATVAITDCFISMEITNFGREVSENYMPVTDSRKLEKETTEML